MSIYKFKSRITGDLIMLEPNGKQVLRIIGKGDEDTLAKGILLPEHMPQAIAQLESAIAHDEAAREQRTKEALDKGETPVHTETVSLKLRATPMIAMIQRCLKAKEEIVWGV